MVILRKSSKKQSLKGPAQPIPLSQDEIAAMARNSRAAANVTKRIRQLVPTKALGTLRSESIVPAPLSAKEMAIIKSSKRPNKRITVKLVAVAEREDPESRKKPKSSKVLPSKRPPKRQR